MPVRRVTCAAAVAAGLLMIAPSAWAQDPIHKMGRGMVNILTSWIEVPKQLDRGRREDNPLAGLSSGILKGVGLTLLRVGVGAYEIVTFPVPYPKDFASPYEQMELRDYAWE